MTWVPSFQLSTGFVALFLYLTIMLTLANLASASIALASDKHLLSIRLFFASLLQFTHSLCVPSVAAFYSSSRLLLIALFPCILASAPCHQPVTLQDFSSDSQNLNAGLGSSAQEEA